MATMEISKVRVVDLQIQVSIYLKDSCYTGACSPMFIAALIRIVRNWKGPTYPSAVEWIMETWYIYTIDS